MGNIIVIRERSQEKEKFLYFCILIKVLGFFFFHCEHLNFALGPTNYVGDFVSRLC